MLRYGASITTTKEKGLVLDPSLYMKYLEVSRTRKKASPGRLLKFVVEAFVRQVSLC